MKIWTGRMKLFFYFALLLFTTTYLNHANAVQIGDKNWRQLTETTNLSFNDVSTVCSAISGDCHGSINGIDIEGWSWANIAEVREMFGILFSSINGHVFTESNFSYSQKNSLWAPALIDLDGTGPDTGIFQATDVDRPNFNYSRVNGITRTSGQYPGGSFYVRGATILDRQPGDYDDAHTKIGTDLDRRNQYFGVWMYQALAPIPEPETYAMMLAGLGLLGVIARRRKQKLNA